METPKRHYLEKFPTVISVFIGILTMIVLYLIIVAPEAFSSTDLLMTSVFCLFAVFLVLHCWMARATRHSFLFWFFGPFYGIYLSVKNYKEIKYLSISYLSVVTTLIILLMLLPTN
ncbi:MAG: hypothetical protein UV80_C0006G0033 [Candidatus Peregrinibacteria bacterium GW2011_GWF2_43_17]|nr:MAG: hypothetical protein UV80_C0006G0033 [Candidatus Peregrinibacteria bacterium GW2011_GWF2_43_17]